MLFEAIIIGGALEYFRLADTKLCYISDLLIRGFALRGLHIYAAYKRGFFF
jgi:hypothetical protein